MPTFAPNFKAAPLGPFIAQSKLKVFQGMPLPWVLCDYDPHGTFFELVPYQNEPCLQMWYPSGHVGMQTPLGTQDFHIRCGIVTEPMTCECDHLWLRGDISEGPLKLAPQIRWDCLNTEPGYIQMLIVSDGKTNQKPYDMIVQGPAGREYVQPIAASRSNVAFNVWTRWKLIYNPLQRWCEFYENSVLIRRQINIPSDPSWNAGFFFAFWAGGGLPINGPKTDTYAIMNNVNLTIG